MLGPAAGPRWVPSCGVSSLLLEEPPDHPAVSPAGRASRPRGTGRASATGRSPLDPSPLRLLLPAPRVTSGSEVPQGHLIDALGPSCCQQETQSGPCGGRVGTVWGPCGDTQRRSRCLSAASPMVIFTEAPTRFRKWLAHHCCSRRFRGPKGRCVDASPRLRATARTSLRGQRGARSMPHVFRFNPQNRRPRPVPPRR